MIAARPVGAGVFVAFGLATVALTWPVAVALDVDYSSHADYFSNVWNIWWVRTSLFELGASPYWTDHLFFPDGVSLARHALSLVNSVPGALVSPFVGYRGGFNLILLANFWLAAWFAYLLALEVTGDRRGAFLAGLVYSFAPYHWFYLSVMNVHSIEWIPLAALFFVRTYREGGARNALGAAVAMMMTGASCWNYLPYLVFLVGALTVCGRLWARQTPARAGTLRVLAAGAAGTLLVAPLAWPLVAESLSSEPLPGLRDLFEGHDLLGFFWVGPPERWILAWPAALGYSGLLLVALGFRDVRRQTTWLLILVGAWVLCLGGSLRVNGVDSGIPLPHAWLVKIPVLSMLRRPDRLLVLVQLAFAVLCAYGWRGFAQRLSSRRTRAAAFATCGAAVCLEFGGAPLASFSNPCSPYYAELAAQSDVGSVLLLPPSSVYGPRAGIYNLCQTVHGKKMTGGYITSLAITPGLFKEALAWSRDFSRLADPDDPMLRERVESKGIDRVVLHKRISISRHELKTNRPFRWEPFAAIKEPLLEVRQTGPVVPTPANPGAVEAAVEALRQRFGAPVHEDDQIVVFRVGRSHE